MFSCITVETRFPHPQTPEAKQVFKTEMEGKELQGRESKAGNQGLCTKDKKRDGERQLVLIKCYMRIAPMLLQNTVPTINYEFACHSITLE